METTTDTTSIPKLDIERAFTFVFKDPDWIKKVAVAAAFAISIVGMPALAGWTLEIQKRVQDGEDDTLPRWTVIGDFFVDGLKYLLVNFVWFLPFSLIYFAVMIPYMLMAINEPSMADNSILPIGVFMLPYLMMPVMMILSFVMYTLMPIISGNYLETRKIKDAFKFRRMFDLVKVNFWVLLAAAFLGYLGNQVFSMVGMFACFVGMFLTIPIGGAVMYHFFGQAYRISKIKLAAKQAAAKEIDNTLAEHPA